MISLPARLVLPALVTLAAHAGPLGFEEVAQLEKPKLNLDCGSCAFITTFEDIPPPFETGQMIVIIGFLAFLGIIGLVGVRFRVRASTRK